MIQPTYLKFSDLLTKRLFRIPEYQRAYSWLSKQRQDLFNDIIAVSKPGATHPHFMATMVALKRATVPIGTDEFQVLEVVDGQPRLTTLIVLLKAIEKALDSQVAPESELKIELQRLLVKGDDLSLVLLQTNHDSSLYFADYLRTGATSPPSAAKALSDRHLLYAMREAEQFVARWKKQGRGIVELVAILKNRLTLILHEIDHESTVYSVFEVLNSRGLSVAWLDRLKSALMGIAFEKAGGNKDEVIAELHEIWKSIYSTIGLRQGTASEALRFAAALKMASRPSKVPPEEEAVETLRSMTGETAAGAVTVSRWVLQVVEAVDRLQADRRRLAVTRIAHARLLAVAIELRDYAEEERVSLIDCWERVTFRIFGMCRKDARTRVGDYVRAAWVAINTDASYEYLLQRIKDISRGEFDIDSAILELGGEDCYEEWGVELRYFLYRREEHLARVAGQKFLSEQWERIWAESPSTSIDHILARSLTPPDVFTHRLGNLVLLPPGLNSSLGAKPPSEKAEAYRSTGLFIANEIVPHLALWGKESIERREQELLEWAKGEWGDPD